MQDDSIPDHYSNPDFQAIAARHHVSVKDVRALQDGTWLVVGRLLFQWMVKRGFFFDHEAEIDLWCFGSEEEARRAFEEYPVKPPNDYEPEGWHSHPKSGRIRIA